MLNKRFDDFECISFEQILTGYSSSEFLFSPSQTSLTDPILIDYRFLVFPDLLNFSSSRQSTVDYPKNIEVIIGKLDHCGYAGIYELKKGTGFLIRLSVGLYSHKSVEK